MSKYVRAQNLNRRAVIQKRGGGVDAANQPLPEDWVEVCRVWCDPNVVSGSAFVNRETISADREVNRSLVSIRIRRRKDILADMRVLIGYEVFEIREVLPDMQDHRYVDLGCARGANNG